MLMSHHQNAGQTHNFLIVTKYFKNVAKFKYLRTKVTNQNCIPEEIKSRLNMGECLLPFTSEILFSHLLSKNLKHYYTIL
jgi:hypothetical protein